MSAEGHSGNNFEDLILLNEKNNINVFSTDLVLHYCSLFFLALRIHIESLMPALKVFLFCSKSISFEVPSDPLALNFLKKIHI